MNNIVSGTTFDLSCFIQSSAIGIVREANLVSINGLLDACVSGGLKYIEFPLNSKESLACIEFTAKEFTGQICVGAGTVISVSDASRAMNLGAKFIVSPTLNIDVALYCKDNGLAYFPGALTPTEIEQSWKAGATMVKLFPASLMGASYISTVQGPFKDILLMAVGGINFLNATEYLRAGASAVAIGGSVFSESRLNNMEFDAIKNDITKFIFAVKSYCSNI